MRRLLSQRRRARVSRRSKLINWPSIYCNYYSTVQKNCSLYLCKKLENSEYSLWNSMHIKNTKFTLKQKQASNITTQKVTVYNYFVQKYNVQLKFQFLPLIETTYNSLFLIELYTIQPNQQFWYKLSPNQTTNIIKFAITQSKEHLQAIQYRVGILKWH